VQKFTLNYKPILPNLKAYLPKAAFFAAGASPCLETQGPLNLVMYILKKNIYLKFGASTP
jgi:hypothetical protein